MKKILSILLAAMLAFSALGATSMMAFAASNTCLLYTSDAADEL